MVASVISLKEPMGIYYSPLMFKIRSLDIQDEFFFEIWGNVKLCY